MKHLFICLALSLVISLASCAFAPVNRPPVNKYSVRNQEVFEIPKKELLDMAQKALNSMGYQTSLVTDNGPVATATMSVLTQQNCDCGTWNNSPIQGKADSLITVKVLAQKDGRNAVFIDANFTVLFTGRNIYGMTTRQESYRCASLGLVENLFWSQMNDLIKARVQKLKNL